MKKERKSLGFFFDAIILAACLGAFLVAIALDDPENNGHHLTAADFDRHVRAIKKQLPDNGFTIVVVKPFVVIGDESPETVQRRAKDTVGWAVEKLKTAYFEHDPPDILDIWLFKDKESYKTNAQKLFHAEYDTPFGYYSAVDKALVMNIATGRGTLVHEIVHPFMAANFPECPAWFNEGLGSLYERFGEENGEIRGYTNWRLPILQRAIRNRQLPSFETLCSMTRDKFCGKDKGTNYAQARYLCYYLQQQGLLKKFYHRFLAARETDPTGYASLQEVLGRKDMAVFQKEWETYVLELRFR